MLLPKTSTVLRKLSGLWSTAKHISSPLGMGKNALLLTDRNNVNKILFLNPFRSRSAFLRLHACQKFRLVLLLVSIAVPVFIFFAFSNYGLFSFAKNERKKPNETYSSCPNIQLTEKRESDIFPVHVFVVRLCLNFAPRCRCDSEAYRKVFFS